MSRPQEGRDDGRVTDSAYFQITLGLLIVFIVGVVLKLARPVLIPFILAVFLSYILDPALTFLTGCRCPRPAAVIIVLVLMLVFLFLAGVLVYSSGKAFVTELPKYQGRLAELSDTVQTLAGRLHTDIPTTLGKIDVERVGGLVLKAIGPFLDVLGKVLLVFLFLVFIVAGRGRAEAKVPKAIGDGHAGRVHGIMDRINVQVRKYLLIKTAMSLVNGLTVWLVLKILGVDFAALFGLLAFFLNFIPSIGSMLAAALRVGFAFFQFGTFWTPFLVLVLTSGSDMIMGNFVEPRIMGKGLGLSPLLIFFSLLFWGWLWGIPGMILSVPLTAMIKIVCQNVPGLKPVAVLMGE